jgi:hypothetical protein
VSIYEKAFVNESNAIGFCNAVDEDYLNPCDGAKSPNLNREMSGKSPTNLLLLDFLEDDAFFVDENKRIKSKTEFVRRERQESEESNYEEFVLPNDA